MGTFPFGSCFFSLLENSGLISFSGKLPLPLSAAARRPGDRLAPLEQAQVVTEQFSHQPEDFGRGGGGGEDRASKQGERGRGEPHAPVSTDPIWKAPQKADEPSPPGRHLVSRLPPRSIPTSRLRGRRANSSTTAAAPTKTGETKLNRPFRPIGSRSSPRPPRTAAGASSFLLQECNNPFTTAIHLTSHPRARAAVTQRAFRSGISPLSLPSSRSLPQIAD